jgi:hypothetical protein
LNKILKGGKIVDKKWYLMVVTLVALSAIVMGTACAVETMIIGPSGDVTDAVAQLPCGTVAHQVNILSGYWMNKLEMVVKTRDGATQSLGIHGYGDTNPSVAFTLADGEYITEVSGDHTPPEIWGGELLYTTEFTTNLGNTYGPYGAAGGTLEDQYPGLSPFDYVAPDGWQIVGFTTTSRDGPNVGPILTLGVIAIPVAECCKNVECEDAPCVKCDLETTTCTAPGEGQPHMMCDDGCVNTQNDDFNCGACGNECDTDAGQKCVSGVCTAKKTK